MKVRDIMAIFSQMDPNSEAKVCCAVGKQVMVDNIERLTVSFSGVMIQTDGFMALMQAKAAAAGEVVPVSKVYDAKPRLTLVKPC
jgi:hypothetical protein